MVKRPMTEEQSKRFHDIFNDSVATNDSQESCVSLAERCRYTIEVTIALPQKWKAYEKLSLPEKLRTYTSLWEELKKLVDVISDAYHFEYHENGYPHMHGYITYWAHASIEMHEELHIKEFAKTVYKFIPKMYWKHYENTKYDAHISRFKSPAITLNWKENLHINWTNYIEKNAPKNCV